MQNVPMWLEWAYRLAAILSALGAGAAFFFVIWPAIRIQTRFIQAQEKKGVEDLIDRL